MEESTSMDSERSNWKIVKNRQLKQAFGKAKLFETRRLVRRLRQISAKKGTSHQLDKNKRKISRLEKQLEILKDLHVGTFVEASSARTLTDKFNSEELICMSIDDEDVATKKNVLEKMINVVGIDFIKGLTSTGNGKQMDMKSSGEEKTSKACGKVASRSGKKLHLMDRKELGSSKVEEKDQDVDNLDDFFADPVIQDSNFVDNDTSVNPSITKKNAQKKRKLLIEDDSEEVSTRALDSLFVESLKSGKEKKNRKSRMGNSREQHKNRLGQRERRKQWEKLYGKKANHLKNEKKKVEDSSVDDKKKKKGKVFHIKGKDKKIEEKNSSFLHPSWEASKSRRKQESIVEFKGQKITFED